MLRVGLNAEYRAANLYLLQIRRIVSLVALQRPGRLSTGLAVLSSTLIASLKTLTKCVFSGHLSRLLEAGMDPCY